MWSETIANRQYLPPYLPRFFELAAEKIPLRGGEDLLDLGCGPGDVAFGFAPYVRSLTGIDLELPMLEAAQRHGAEIGREIRVIHSKTEEAPENLGPFDFITIGTAYWFMHSPATLRRIEGWLKPGGRLLICVPRNDNVGKERWFEVFMALHRRWSRATDLYTKMSLPIREFLRGTDFVPVEQVAAYGEREITLDYLLGRALAFPTTSREILGDDAEPMLAAMRTELEPFFALGPIKEQHCTLGVIFRRSGDR